MSASLLEVWPFTIPTASSDQNEVQTAVSCYVMRWLTTVWLFFSIGKALFKRNIRHISMLLRPDTYEDLKLEIWIVLCQIISLSFTA